MNKAKILLLIIIILIYIKNSILSKSQIRSCVKSSSAESKSDETLTKCDKKLLITLSLENNQGAGSETIVVERVSTEYESEETLVIPLEIRMSAHPIDVV